MILVDTNVIVAATNPTDRDHTRAASFFTAAVEPLLVLSTVIAETCYLIDKHLGAAAEALFLRSVGAGDMQLVDLTPRDLDRMADLVDQYAELRLGGTDASVVAVAERLKITRVATFNRRDFAVVRPSHVATFELLPL